MGNYIFHHIISVARKKHGIQGPTSQFSKIFYSTTTPQPEEIYTLKIFLKIHHLAMNNSNFIQTNISHHWVFPIWWKPRMLEKVIITSSLCFFFQSQGNSIQMDQSLIPVCLDN